ncbi:hypothetical protein T06_12244 [Trichinella sp. T6]|nr:hypothetical protein T06_12244 [Trichinella sp. T6]
MSDDVPAAQLLNKQRDTSKTLARKEARDQLLENQGIATPVKFKYRTQASQEKDEKCIESIAVQGLEEHELTKKIEQISINDGNESVVTESIDTKTIDQTENEDAVAPVTEPEMKTTSAIEQHIDIRTFDCYTESLEDKLKQDVKNVLDEVERRTSESNFVKNGIEALGNCMKNLERTTLQLAEDVEALTSVVTGQNWKKDFISRMDISDYVTKSTETRIVDTSTAVRPVSSESNQSTSLSTVTATKSLDVRERLASVAQSKRIMESEG